MNSAQPSSPFDVIPAKAGIHGSPKNIRWHKVTMGPAFAGTTARDGNGNNGQKTKR